LVKFTIFDKIDIVARLSLSIDDLIFVKSLFLKAVLQVLYFFVIPVFELGA